MFNLLCAALMTVVVSAPETSRDSRVGKVVSAGNGKITIAMEQGRQESYDVAQEAVIMLNEEPSTLDRLTLGDEATLTLQTKNSQQVVTKIDAKSAAQKASAGRPAATAT